MGEGLFFRYQRVLVWIFLGHSMNIFRVNWRAWICFSFNFPWREYFFGSSPPPPPPNKFSNGPSLIISDITDTGVSSAVRVSGVSVIARCPRGESWLYFVNNNNNNKMTLNTFHRHFFNKVIEFIVTFSPKCGPYSRAVINRGRRALSRGGVYSSKCDNWQH